MNRGFNMTISTGNSVTVARKLIPIHNAKRRPISELKRICEKVQRRVPVIMVIAVKVTDFPDVATARCTAAGKEMPVRYSSTMRLTM